MQFRLESGNARHILRVTDDGTEDPFAVVFDPTAGQAVVDALNAAAIVGQLAAEAFGRVASSGVRS